MKKTELKKHIVCYFHRIDFDGRCSGFLVRKWAKDHGYTCECIGINQKEDFDKSKVEHNTVVICDFTFEPEQMFDIQNLAEEVIWLDHHKTSIDKMKSYMIEHRIKNPFKGIQVVGIAGCELTYLYFFKQGIGQAEAEALAKNTSTLHNYLPRFIFLLGRYDVWDQSNKVAFELGLDLQYGLKQYDMDPTSPYWTQLFRPDEVFFKQVLADGPKFRAYTEQQNKWYLEEYGYEAQFKDATFNDLTVYAQCTGFKGSQNFCDKMDKYDVLCAYIHRPDGMFGISFYSATGTDVSVIAKAYGGGGHAGAAGCILKELPIEKKA